MRGTTLTIARNPFDNFTADSSLNSLPEQNSKTDSDADTVCRRSQNCHRHNSRGTLSVTVELKLLFVKLKLLFGKLYSVLSVRSKRTELWQCHCQCAESREKGVLFKTYCDGDVDGWSRNTRRPLLLESSCPGRERFDHSRRPELALQSTARGGDF